MRADFSNPSRRDLMKALAAGGAAAMAAEKLLAGETPTKSVAKGGRIDVHHHTSPPALRQGPGRAGRREWSPEYSLEMMDKNDIAVAILTMTQMGNLLYDNTEKGRKNVRLGNDYGAKVMAQYPKRFGLMTGVPLPDIDGVMKEIEYGLDTLKADGIGIYTNDNQTRWPGDKYFDPMWKELNRRKAVVYMHPLAPPCCVNLNDDVPSAMNEYDFDITRACTSILANGVLHNYPDVKIIIPHSGGTMPMIAGRIKDRYALTKNPGRDSFIPNGVIAELQKFYIDIAHALFPYPMAAMMKFALPDHVMFGTDFSPEPMESTVNEIPKLGLSDKQWRAIDRENAEKLFPRFKVAS